MSEYSTNLARVVTDSMTHTHEAQRRLWAASDEVARLRRDLSAAEERQATAEREYKQSADLTHMAWDSLKDDILAQKTADLGIPPAAQAEAEAALAADRSETARKETRQ